MAIYERQGRLEDAIRVLERAIEVFRASRRRTAEDRRAVLSVFRNRLREARQRLRQVRRTR